MASGWCLQPVRPPPPSVLRKGSGCSTPPRPRNASEKSLVDTNLLVYQHDPRYPRQQAIASERLRRGLESQTLAIAYPAVVEFVTAISRPQRGPGGMPLPEPAEALGEAEELLIQFPVLYPSCDHVVGAMRATMFHDLPWFDAQMRAYAELGGLHKLLSEDFQHGRHYGTIRAVNPFLQDGSAVHELPPLYSATAAGLCG